MLSMVRPLREHSAEGRGVFYRNPSYLDSLNQLQMSTNIPYFHNPKEVLKNIHLYDTSSLRCFPCLSSQIKMCNWLYLRPSSRSRRPLWSSSCALLQQANWLVEEAWLEALRLALTWTLALETRSPLS